MPHSDIVVIDHLLRPVAGGSTRLNHILGYFASGAGSLKLAGRNGFFHQRLNDIGIPRLRVGDLWAPLYGTCSILVYFMKKLQGYINDCILEGTSRSVFD